MGAYSEIEKELLGRTNKSVHEFFTEQLRRKFMKLPKAQKDLIREAQTAGFEWKGEDTQTRHVHLGNISHFQHVFNEWKKMKEIGIVEYRKTALAALDRLTRRYVGRNA